MFGHLLRDVAAEVGICMDHLVFGKDARTTLAFVRTFPNGDRDFSFYRNPGAAILRGKYPNIRLQKGRRDQDHRGRGHLERGHPLHAGAG